MIIKNELISASILSLLVTLLVWWNTPYNNFRDDGMTKVLLKTMIVSFVVVYILLYFLNDSGSDEVIDNIIKGKPDF